MDRPAILGIATARPAHSLSQSESADIAVSCCARGERQARLLRRLYQTTTVDRRGTVLLGTETSNGRPDIASVRAFLRSPDEQPRGPTTAARMAVFEQAAPPLAVEAAAAAMERARIPAAHVTHLVTVTCTGFASPGVEHELIRTLALPPGTQRVQVGFMGCHAALNGLRVAQALASADPDHRVLLCCVELCSLHFQYGWDDQKLVANALFADGAAAMVIGRSKSVHEAPRIAGSASQIIENTGEEMTWTIGDHGFEMTLSPRVPGLIADHLRPWIDDFLASEDLRVGDVRGWCIHAGGPRIVSAVADRLGANGQAIAMSRSVLREHGNMSSATVMFILERMLEGNLPRPWVALAFGPGLTAEAALLA